ncbi:MAG: phytoene desaturase [Armatimonadetes bacterium]|nr:phytoene desaturase [Armatimonadota bacterium]
MNRSAGKVNLAGKLWDMDVIVIGGGIGGLSAAIGLAAGGARVTLLEKNARLGGKLNVWEYGGFTFDTGPHVLTMPWALDEVFQAAGRRLAAELPLTPLKTVCRYHFPRKPLLYLDIPSDPNAAAQAINDFAPGQAAGFRRFLAYARQVSDATTEPFLRQDFGASVRGVPSRQQWRQLAAFLALKPWRSLRDVVRECFSDPRLRRIFELYALYSGSHPARCSSIFATVADVQWRQGTYYVPGGLYRLAEKLSQIAQDLGINIATESSVKEVIVKAGRARGIRTASGERLYADAVVCNADCLTAMKTLIPPEHRCRWPDRRVDAIEPSTSAFLLLLGVAGTYPQLAHHNSFLAADGDAEFRSIFDARRPADDPTVGVACQSVTDPTKAPPGCSNLFVMTNPPALPPDPQSWGSQTFDWHTEAPAYREQVLCKLETMGLTDLRQRIQVEQMWTPLDLQSRYGAHRGAIYGLSSNGWRNAFLRPPQVSPDVQGLYFVGGSTHPGGGLPLCALSGMNAARRIASSE